MLKTMQVIQNQKQANKPIKTYINSCYPSLTKSEQKVADLVLEKMENVMYYSVTDMADMAGVGETTVLRFCRKIGYKAYQEFKLAIAKDQSAVQNDQSENSDEHVKQENFISAIAANSISAIQETASMLDEGALEKALELIEKARSVHFFGVGTSGLTALDAKNRFLRIGRRTDAVIDSHIQAMTASTLTSEDVVIGLTVSGSTKDTIDSLKIARENGANIISITYYARSPITKISDVVLLSGGKESPMEGGSLAAKIGQLFVIDLLCTGLALRTKDFSLSMKERTARSVLDKIY
jgi:DNA-binding MurR/RpiR family transcriptional regulator